MFRHVLLALPWYHHKIHKGVSRYASEHNWHVDAEGTRLQSYSSVWEGDGIITQVPRDELMKNLIESYDLPTVNISPIFTGENIPNIYDPNDHIARTAFDYFLGRGFCRFTTFQRSHFLHGRLDEFHKIVAKNSLTCEQLVYEGENNSRNRCQWLMQELPKLPKPTALFVESDDIGAEVIFAAVQAGIKVPEDLAVLGVHNDDLVCEATAVSLSSIDCGLEQMGYEAARVLDSMMKGEPAPKEQVLIRCAKVITRASTDIMAIDNPKIRAALLFIRENYKHQIAIKDVAEVASLSVSGLQYLLNSHLGISPAKEITRVRLDHARHMLLTTHWSIDMVSSESGFQTARNFYRVFSQKEGISPDAFRKKYRSPAIG